MRDLIKIEIYLKDTTKDLNHVWKPLKLKMHLNTGLDLNFNASSITNTQIDTPSPATLIWKSKLKMESCSESLSLVSFWPFITLSCALRLPRESRYLFRLSAHLASTPDASSNLVRLFSGSTIKKSLTIQWTFNGKWIIMNTSHERTVELPKDLAHCEGCTSGEHWLLGHNVSWPAIAVY